MKGLYKGKEDFCTTLTFRSMEGRKTLLRIQK